MSELTNNPIAFTFKENQVRTMKDDTDQIWFVVKDVFDALGLKWKGASASLQTIPEDWKGVCYFQTPSSATKKVGGGKQKLITVNEPALYKLVFRSRKPEAEAFTNWVVSEVLPQIRKTGSYTHESGQYITDHRWSEKVDLKKIFDNCLPLYNIIHFGSRAVNWGCTEDEVIRFIEHELERAQIYKAAFARKVEASIRKREGGAA